MGTKVGTHLEAFALIMAFALCNYGKTHYELCVPFFLA
jgi:hypothetical protein